MTEFGMTHPKGYEIVRQGLELQDPTALTQADWEKMGQTFSRGFDNWHWVIGDWLIYGEEVLVKRTWASHKRPAQSMYERAAQITGIEPDTLQLCARVSRAYLRSERVWGISWSKHKEIAGYDTKVRQELLHTCLDKAWNLTTWHKNIGRYSKGRTPGSGRKREVKCPNCGTLIHV